METTLHRSAKEAVGGLPRAIGTPDDAFLEILKRLKKCGARSVLDAPSGRGRFTQMLKDGGFEVAACDILPEIFEVPDVECLRADLNKKLPYDDASFDAVASCSGIHRVHAVGRAMSEYVRVLKPGGTLLMTLPNFTKLSRRLRFFISGVNSWAVVRLSKEVENPEAHFRQSAGLPQVLYVMHAMGLEVLSISGERFRPKQLLLLPFVPCIKLALPFLPAKKRKSYFLKEASSLPALLSDFVLIEARKPGSGKA